MPLKMMASYHEGHASASVQFALAKSFLLSAECASSRRKQSAKYQFFFFFSLYGFGGFYIRPEVLSTRVVKS